MPPKTTLETKQKIMDLLDQGISERKIALRFHSSRETVAKIRRERNNKESIIDVKDQIQFTINLKIQVTPRPDGYLVELDYGKPELPEPFNTMELEINNKINNMVDDALKRKKFYSKSKRDLRYKGIRFPSQFIISKEENK